MKHLKRLVVTVLIAAALAALIATKWAMTPARPDITRPDAAIVQLNDRNNDSDPYKEDYFQHAGHSLHYVEAGKGELVLFLHGFPSYWLSFLRQMDALKDDYHVVAIDGLGTGKSDAPRDVESYKLENMAQHVLALIDHLGADKVHLVGHDWGSTFAFGFAQRYPDRVASVTGLSAPPQNVLLHLMETEPELRKTSGYIERLKQANPLLIVALGGDKQVWTGAYEPLVAAGHMTAEEGELFRGPTGNPKRINAHINWYRANIPSFDAIGDKSFWPSRNARLRMPAQIIWGNKDRVFAREYAENITAYADDIKLLPLADVGHWPHWERSAAVTDAIGNLISGNNSPD